MSTVLVLDNYDSFVYTIAGYLENLGARVEVVRNDSFGGQVTDYAGVLISPGPGAPENAGVSCDLISQCAIKQVPLLGICLGHQAIGTTFGATVDHAPELMHGKTSLIKHNNQGIFADLPSPLTVTRYHSLAVVPATVPPELEVTATTDSGIIMGLKHREFPLEGVQFHPESILTESGHLMLANWLEKVGVTEARASASKLKPLRVKSANSAT